MQCDCTASSARTFTTRRDVDENLEAQRALVESWTNNDDFTEFEFTLLRDHLPRRTLNAEAVVYNLQEAGSGLLIRMPSPTTAAIRTERSGDEATGEYTFTIKTGSGDLSQPRLVAEPARHARRPARLIASPTWLQAVKDGTGDPIMAVGSGPFIVESYARGMLPVVKRNPDYIDDGPGW
ncbi:MAG: ABC transporter substrate-binding protein [Ilumatobacteraceae bacterium]